MTKISFFSSFQKRFVLPSGSSWSKRALVLVSCTRLNSVWYQEKTTVFKDLKLKSVKAPVWPKFQDEIKFIRKICETQKSKKTLERLCWVNFVMCKRVKRHNLWYKWRIFRYWQWKSVFINGDTWTHALYPWLETLWPVLLKCTPDTLTSNVLALTKETNLEKLLSFPFWTRVHSECHLDEVVVRVQFRLIYFALLNLAPARKICWPVVHVQIESLRWRIDLYKIDVATFSFMYIIKDMNMLLCWVMMK